MIKNAFEFCFKKWKLFAFTFAMSFLMVVLPKLGVLDSTQMVSPVPQKVDVFEQIKPRLEKYSSDFKLKKQANIIPQTRAGADFDQASSYAVVDLDTGEVIVEKNLSKRLPIASITKLMTAVVALDLVSSLDQKFVVSEKVSNMAPTKVMLKPGEVVSVELLLKSSILASANDSAQVLKEGVDQMYQEEVFIKAMNEKAKILGMNNTYFTNPQGFDNSNHYSSAEDLAILVNYALKNYPFIKEVVAKEFEDMNTGEETRFFLNNWNGLLGTYPGSFGVKIGNTGNAGYTTAVAAQRGGNNLLVVLLGAPGVLERDLWSAQLLDIGFEKIAGLEPVDITKEQLMGKYASWKYERR